MTMHVHKNVLIDLFIADFVTFFIDYQVALMLSGMGSSGVDVFRMVRFIFFFYQFLKIQFLGQLPC